MTKSEQIHTLRCALEWSLKNGVKAVDYSATGFWHHKSGEGSEIMPPAHLHVELDRARGVALQSAVLGMKVIVDPSLPPGTIEMRGPHNTVRVVGLAVDGEVKP